MAGALETCVFVIDQYIPLKKKVELIRMIKSNGGKSVYSVSDKVLTFLLQTLDDIKHPHYDFQSTHLVTTQEGFNEWSAKVAAAKSLGVHIVSKEFVVDSVTNNSKQDEKQYYFNATAPPTPTATQVPQPPITQPSLTVNIQTQTRPQQQQQQHQQQQQQQQQQHHQQHQHQQKLQQQQPQI